jgi:hypothetical protein
MITPETELDITGEKASLRKCHLIHGNGECKNTATDDPTEIHGDSLQDMISQK